MFGKPKKELTEHKLKGLQEQFKKFESIKDYSKYKSPEAAKLLKVLNAKMILDNMTETKSDFGLLDPSGKRDGAEIEGVLRGFMREHYVQEARDDLRVLTHGVKKLEILGPDYYRGEIDKNLKKAGAGYSALEPEKNLGDFQAKHYIVEKAYKGAHLRCAQMKFTKLKEGIPLIEATIAGSMGGKFGPDKLAGEIKEHLRKADSSFSALDPEHKKTDKEMKQELADAVTNHEYRVDDKEGFRKQLEVLRGMPGRGRSR